PDSVTGRVLRPAPFSSISSDEQELLRRRNHSKQAIQSVLRSGGKVKLIGLPVRLGAAAKLDRPKLIGLDWLVVCIRDGPNQLPGLYIEAVDRAAVGIVRNQQRAA